MAAPAEGGAGGAGAAAPAPAANVLTFNDASSFDKLTDCRLEEFPSGPIALHEFKKDPSPDLVESFKPKLAEMHGIPAELVKHIQYVPELRTIVFMDAPVPIPVCILPAGSILHRFDKEGAHDPSKEVPIFFGNKASVSFYSGKKTPEEINATRSSYRLKRPARLLHINAEAMKRFAELSITPEEAEFFEVYYRHGFVRNSKGENVETPIILPATPYGTIAEMRSQTREKTFNRRFAEIVCRLGFDGWVIKQLNPDKQEGVIQITCGTPQLRSPDGTVVTIDKLGTLSREQGTQARLIAPLDGNLSPMPPEIVICRWDVFMDRVKGGSRRRRHASSHRRARHHSRRRHR